MGGLQHPLQVRRIALGQGELLGEAFQRYLPRAPRIDARHLEDSVQAPGHGGRQLLVPCRGERDGEARCQVRADLRRQGDVCVARFVVGERAEQRQLVAVGEASPINGNRRQHGELAGPERADRGVKPGVGRFERRPLEPGERAAQLLVRAPVHAAPHGAKEGMQGEGQHAVGGSAGLVIAPHQLHVNVLVEGPGKPLARRRQDAPPPTASGGVADRDFFTRVAESEERQGLERAIENDGARELPPSGCGTHSAMKVGPAVKRSKSRLSPVR